MRRLVIYVHGKGGNAKESEHYKMFFAGSDVIGFDYKVQNPWGYLRYVRKHPIEWHVPTCILYGGRDNLTSRETISEFAERIGAVLTIIEDGEH